MVPNATQARAAAILSTSEEYSSAISIHTSVFGFVSRDVRDEKMSIIEMR